MKKAVLLFCLLSFVLLPQSDSLNAKLLQIKSNHNVLGMTVCVAKGGEIVFSKGYGIRDYGRNLTMNDSSMYRIASISKTITAIALMKLYESGAFSLDDDISNYLGFQLRNPSFPSQIITIRKVLSHTSSLRDGTGYDGFLSASYNNNPPPSLSALFTSGGSYYTANMFSSSYGPSANYFTYSNINYGVIGTLIEKLSNKRFDVFCRENIFIPLGLNASFNIQDLSDFNNLAVLYRRSGSVWQPQLDNYLGVKPPPRDLSGYVVGSNGLIFAPQGGLRISGRDLAKIMVMLKNGGIFKGVRILNDSTVSRMINPTWIYNGSNGNNYYGIFNTYGVGIHRSGELLPGETVYGHPGEAYGLISDMYFSKVGDYGIVFITNGGEWGNGSYSGWYNVEENVFKAAFSQINYLPVPVELVSFSGVREKNKVTLTWVTASELNNHRFEIERKTLDADGEWTLAGYTEGKGTSTEENVYTFTDDIDGIGSKKIAYRLKQIDFNGKFEYSDEIVIDNSAPVDFNLYQNYPNPFNPETVIRYAIAEDSKVSLKVFDILGNELSVLADGFLAAGEYSTKVNSINLSSGVYFYRLKAGNFMMTRKMSVLR